MRFADAMGLLPLNSGFELVYTAVREGMAPFRFYCSELYHEFDIDYNTYWLFAEVRLSNGARIAHKERVDESELMNEPAKEAMRIADLMLKAFRNRVTEPIHDKIVLGEE